MSITEIANLQPLVLGFILLWSGIWKIAFSASLKAAYNSSLSVFLKNKKLLVKAAFLSLGVGELCLGVGLLLPPTYALESQIASVLALGFLLYLLLSKKFMPDLPCGCLSNSTKPISWRPIIRAIYLLSIALVGFSASGSWFITIMSKPLLMSTITKNCRDGCWYFICYKEFS
jgi:hypothetical protein